MTTDQNTVLLIGACSTRIPLNIDPTQTANPANHRQTCRRVYLTHFQNISIGKHPSLTEPRADPANESLRQWNLSDRQGRIPQSTASRAYFIILRCNTAMKTEDFMRRLFCWYFCSPILIPRCIQGVILSKRTASSNPLYCLDYRLRWNDLPVPSWLQNGITSIIEARSLSKSLISAIHFPSYGDDPLE